MPTRSRARYRVRVFLSHTAKANMPLSRFRVCRHTPMGAGLDQDLAVRMPAKHSSRRRPTRAATRRDCRSRRCTSRRGARKKSASVVDPLPRDRVSKAAGVRAKSRPPDRPRRRNHPARGGAMSPPSPSRSPSGARGSTNRVHQGILRCRTFGQNGPRTFRTPDDKLSVD